MGFRPNCSTCITHLYLYYTLLVPDTYASYIRHWCIFFHWEIQYNLLVFLTWYQSHLLVAMVFCPCGIFKSNLCLPRCFFAAFIFFGFLLLPSKLSGIVMPPLEDTSTLQDYCLPQTTVTKPNFIQAIFLTLSNLKISSSFYLEFERRC